MATLSAAGVPWYFDEQARAYRVRDGYRFPILEHACDDCPGTHENANECVDTKDAAQLLKRGRSLASDLDAYLNRLQTFIDANREAK